jgi:hypothetical protein
MFVLIKRATIALTQIMSVLLCLFVVFSVGNAIDFSDSYTRSKKFDLPYSTPNTNISKNTLSDTHSQFQENCCFTLNNTADSCEYFFTKTSCGKACCIATPCVCGAGCIALTPALFYTASSLVSPECACLLSPVFLAACMPGSAVGLSFLMHSGALFLNEYCGYNINMNYRGGK